MKLRCAIAIAVATFAGPSSASADVVTAWNAITAACVTAGRPGPTGVVDIALVQGAVHDAVQAIQGRFESYRYRNPIRLGVGSADAAVAAAVCTEPARRVSRQCRIRRSLSRAILA